MKRAVQGAAVACAIVAGAVLLLSTALGGELDAGPSRLESVLGREVRTPQGDGGRIIDLLADAEGSVRAAVIEFGGFLGIGTRKIAVEWSSVRFVNDGARLSVVVDVTRDQLRAAPEYKPSEPVVLRTESY